MKVCPQCQTTYTDDNLQYCLQDGTPLVNKNISQNWTEAETLVTPKFTTNKITPEWQNPSQPNWAESQQTQIAAPPQKSRTGLIVALTALVTLVVVGAAIGGFLIYQRNHQVEIVQNTNVNSKPSNVNTNQKTNANSTPTPTQTPAPTPKPTLNPKNVEEIKSDVRSVLDDWRDSTENGDLDAHLSDYADTVDYYNAGKVSSEKVRADREKAFQTYPNIEVVLDNIKIVPDETGEKAVVTFDKEWNFQNDEKTNSGKVQQQLTFGKINGNWRITGEKDLKVYYVNK